MSNPASNFPNMRNLPNLGGCRTPPPIPPYLRPCSSVATFGTKCKLLEKSRSLAQKINSPLSSIMWLNFHKISFLNHIIFSMLKISFYILSMQDITSSIHKSEIKRRHKRRSPRSVAITAHARHRPSKTFQMKKNISQPTNFEENPELWYLNPRFNFTDALADINKRLISQKSFWIKLWN